MQFAVTVTTRFTDRERAPETAIVTVEAPDAMAAREIAVHGAATAEGVMYAVTNGLQPAEAA